MKNIISKILVSALIAGCGTASAADFGLEGVGAAGVRTLSFEKTVTVSEPDPGDLIGVDMTVRVPYSYLKNAIGQMATADGRLTVIDAAAPVVGKSGEFMKVSNIRVNVGGIVVEPVITVKIYMEGRDKVAVKIQKVQLHAEMTPNKSAGEIDPATVTQEDLMEKVMEVMISGIHGALNAKLKAKDLPFTSEQMLKITYDKAAWILHTKVSPKVVQHMIPAGIIGDLHLTGFAVTTTGLNVTVQTAQ